MLSTSCNKYQINIPNVSLFDVALRGLIVASVTTAGVPATVW